MSISRTIRMCEDKSVNTFRRRWRAWLFALVTIATGFSAAAQTNKPLSTNRTSSPVASAPQKLDESAFGIVSERNIFNANRSGGQVRVASSRRAPRVETFTLVGTMAYEKGVFAFFEGSSSEFSKVLKANSVIAGHKVMDIMSDAVKLEADGKEIDLPVGSQMRREDEGTWHVAAVTASGGGGETASSSSSRSGESSSRPSRSSRDSGRSGDSSSRRRGESNSSRNDNAESTNRSAATISEETQKEIEKRLMERREKD